MKNKSTQVLFFPVIVLLLVAVSLQFLPRTSTYYFKPEAKLTTYFPESGEGWTAEDVPLGANESLITQVNAILQFDDYLYRRYTKGDREFSIYIAYWNPHSQSDSVVGSHNPDVCWVQNGWKMKEEPVPFHLIKDGKQSLDGQNRIFNIEGHQRYVAFWHVKGGVLTGAAVGEQTNLIHRAPYVINNLMHSGFGMREYEMIFVRIDASVPLESLRNDPVFTKVSDAVFKMGVGGASTHD